MSLTALAAVSIGLHIASQHVPEYEYHEQKNVGMYVQADRVLVGAYRNSLGRDSIYAAYAHPLGHGFELLAGAASGYMKKCHSVYTTETTVEKMGSTLITTVSTTGMEFCSGHGRGYLVPVAGLTYTAPFKVLGASPRVWAVPGTKDSASVVHLSLQWSLK